MFAKEERMPQSSEKWRKDVRNHSLNSNAREERGRYSDTKADTPLQPMENTSAEQLFSSILWMIFHWTEFFPSRTQKRTLYIHCSCKFFLRKGLMEPGEEKSLTGQCREGRSCYSHWANSVSADKLDLDANVVVKIMVEFTKIMNLILVTFCLPTPNSDDNSNLCTQMSAWLKSILCNLADNNELGGAVALLEGRDDLQRVVDKLEGWAITYEVCLTR